jgi:hypothetical protein
VTAERVALWLLFSFASGISGWRAAAGRDGRIDKSAYFARAYLEGLVLGQVAFALVAGPALWLERRDASLKADFDECAQRVLQVWIPYAVLVLSTFVVRVIPSVDVRSATSVLIFAPADVAQPIVVAAGLSYAVVVRPRPEVVVVALAAGISGVLVRKLLERRRR